MNQIRITGFGYNEPVRIGIKKGARIMDQRKDARIEERNSLKVRNRGELIAAIRKKLGYSQEELEWRSGVSRTHLLPMYGEESYSRGWEGGPVHKKFRAWKH